MKKPLIALLLIIFATACKKETSNILTYPKTDLVGTTWKGNPSTSIYGGVSYEFIKFNSSTSVTITFAAADGITNAASTNFNCVIKTNSNNIDSFELTNSNGKDYVGFTTDNVTQITFEGATYTRFK